MENQQKLVPMHRGGRPPAREPASTVSAWVPVHVHDRLIALAERRGVSVSELVRQVLVLQLSK